MVCDGIILVVSQADKERIAELMGFIKQAQG